MTEANLQAIFDRKFGGYIWHGKKLNKYTPLPVKTAMSRQLFNECYQRSSDVEIHYRSGSAPQFGVVANSANYLPLQKVFLDVVATYLNKNLILI
uniref:Uncharacterized protein n=1 Tax=Acrobeloides nanus TaxID=290746 RepID=A0A914D175_9BILA